jgi:hypothetical protein
MEIVLSDRTGQDRKYRVEYACYSMTQDEARKYIDSVSGAQGRQQMISSQSMYHQPQQYVQMPLSMNMNVGTNMGGAMGPQHR